jgi:transposase-like protein
LALLRRQLVVRIISDSRSSLILGIARSTLHRWLSRFEKQGQQGLKDLSKKPKRLARLKVTDEQEQLILQIEPLSRFANTMAMGRNASSQSSQHAAIASSPIVPFYNYLLCAVIWRVLHKHQVAL